jgi:hypothetical protein
MFMSECHWKNARRQRFKQENHLQEWIFTKKLDGQKKMFESDVELSLFQLQSAKMHAPSQSLGETPFNPLQ